MALDEVIKEINNDIEEYKELINQEINDDITKYYKELLINKININNKIIDNCLKLELRNDNSYSNIDDLLDIKNKLTIFLNK